MSRLPIGVSSSSSSNGSASVSAEKFNSIAWLSSFVLLSSFLLLLFVGVFSTVLSSCKLPYLFFNVMFIVLASVSVFFSFLSSFYFLPLCVATASVHCVRRVPFFSSPPGSGVSSLVVSQARTFMGSPIHADVLFAVILEVSELVSDSAEVGSCWTSCTNLVIYGPVDQLSLLPSLCSLGNLFDSDLWFYRSHILESYLGSCI